jgi:hypothetical protein
MLVVELDLTGIVRDTSGGNIAVVMGPTTRVFPPRRRRDLRRERDRDRSVAGTVTFRQQVDDPRLIKPYRDVVKRLVPQGEEKANE